MSIIQQLATRLPAPVQRAGGKALQLLPERVQRRLNPSFFGFTSSDVPEPPQSPDARTRLYIAPVNFAGQGYEWARAAERLDDVGALSMQYVSPGDFGFPSDNRVPVNVFLKSSEWQRAQFAAVSQFTHVLVEAERPIFGALFNKDVEREVTALRDAGVNVAMLSHGSDLRLPSRHKTIDRWSPFHDDWSLVPVLEEQSRKHHALLEKLGAPVFVSTPDLLLDWPDATWLPLSLNAAPWTNDDTILERDVPVVVHAPSSARIKGTHLVEPTLQKMDAAELISYRRVEGVPASQIPALYREADIVIEQFRVGTYSRAAVEAMAAGRIVIAHLHDQVRNVVTDVMGVEPPVVEATPDTLESVLRDIVSNRDTYREIGARGPEFVSHAHDGRMSAEALRPFLES